MPVKKVITKSKTVRGPAAAVSRRASSTRSSLAAATRRDPSSASPLTSKTKGSLSVPVYSLLGSSAGTMSLPKEVFGTEVNKKLLSQAMRVYMTNQKTLPGHTKTRGQVEGSSVKIYRQKGTGRARHGSIRANLFVGGGIVFGPTHRKVVLDLPKKMKKASLISALSSKALEKQVFGVSGLEKTVGKTSEIAKLIKKLNLKTTLIVTDKAVDTLSRAVKNIQGIDVLSANLINVYEVLKHDTLLITKEAVEKLEGKK